MDNLLGTLVLVLPGMVAFYFLQNIGPAGNRVLSDYEKTIIGLLLNIPGLVVTWLVLSIIKCREVSFSEFQTLLMKMPNFIVYVIVAITTGIFTSLIWNRWGRVITHNFFNRNRTKMGRPASSPITPWEEFYGPEESRFFKIYPLGEPDKFVFGEVTSVFIPGDLEKGIVLWSTKELEQWNGWFPEPERTYVDTVTKLVYEMYPTSAWEVAKRRANEYQASLSSSEVLAEEESP